MHLAKQHLKDACAYEVILVDNNSNDNTAEVAKDIWREMECAVPLNVVLESNPGLCYARKAGVLASKADIIVFCDDDNWLQSDYVQIAYEFMSANPTVGALGGQSIGSLENEEPVWWQEEKLNYAAGKQAIASGDISSRGYLWGAGLVVRRGALLKLYNTGFTSLLTGRKGKMLASGDDSEICKWILLMGYKLWYLETLKFTHFITEKRLTNAYLTKLKEGHHESQYILKLYNWYLRVGTKKSDQKSIFLKVKKSTKLILKGFLKKDKRWKEKLQLVIGSRIKIHPIIFEINKTFLLLKLS